MAEKTKTEKEAPKEAVVLVSDAKKDEVKVVCPVCGHANPEHTALCKMCSNYLT